MPRTIAKIAAVKGRVQKRPVQRHICSKGPFHQSCAPCPPASTQAATHVDIGMEATIEGLLRYVIVFSCESPGCYA